MPTLGWELYIITPILATPATCLNPEKCLCCGSAIYHAYVVNEQFPSAVVRTGIAVDLRGGIALDRASSSHMSKPSSPFWRTAVAALAH